ncbi:MAG: hypothetical protein F9K35_04750 [Burkholderiaceae bacterium]|nr:MAG: hypothetical protein F9K35_04750 [Burkholderiaceae bacterium]
MGHVFSHDRTSGNSRTSQRTGDVAGTAARNALRAMPLCVQRQDQHAEQRRQANGNPVFDG